MIFTVTDLSSRNGIFIVPSDGSPVFYQNMQSSSYKLLEVEITSNNSVAAEGQMHSTGKYFVALGLELTSNGIEEGSSFSLFLSN